MFVKVPLIFYDDIFTFLLVNYKMKLKSLLSKKFLAFYKVVNIISLVKRNYVKPFIPNNFTLTRKLKSLQDLWIVWS